MDVALLLNTRLAQVKSDAQLCLLCDIKLRPFIKNIINYKADGGSTTAMPALAAGLFCCQDVFLVV